MNAGADTALVGFLHDKFFILTANSLHHYGTQNVYGIRYVRPLDGTLLVGSQYFYSAVVRVFSPGKSACQEPPPACLATKYLPPR